MSMDCDEDNGNTNSSNTYTHRMQYRSNPMLTANDENMNNNPNHTLKPILYSDSMDLDNATETKPCTLFSSLLAKRRQCTRNRKKRHSLSSATDINDKLTKEELRVVKDLKEISDSKWCARGTIVTIHLSIRLHNFKCTISPAEGYYRDGTFSFDIRIDKNYPYSPPQIHACHPIFHPNINMETLEIGLPIVSPTDWKAVLSLNDVLFALQLLFMQPNIDGIDAMQSTQRDQGMNVCHTERTKANGYHRNYGFGMNNHKPSYIPNICYEQNTCGARIIQNMKAALMFRDNPREFEHVSQQIIKGGVRMFGTNWQCIERKKMKNIFISKENVERYDPSLGSQTLRLRDTDTTLTKKSSVLRKRRRNESEHDVFAMDKVKKALRCFASSTGSMKDGVYSDSSDTLVHELNSIAIEPPEKKRRVDTKGLTESDTKSFNLGQNGIHIVRHNDGYEEMPKGFEFPWNECQKNGNDLSPNDNDFNMN
eukprot:61238_1